jgi:serine/threonine protein kinase
MSSLFLDAVSANQQVKNQLKILSKDIAFSREVTKGGNCYLFFGKNRILNQDVAVKFYYWGGNKKYHAEPHILASMKSPHILNVQNAGLIDGDWAYFITPYCANGDIDDLLERTALGNIAAIDLTCGLLVGLGALHERRFLHRDLKPANIYVDDNNRAIIGDFGSIRFLPQEEDVIPASGHAILYRPPESFESNHYSFSGDIYQVGMVFYQLLGGRLPYDEISWLNVKEKKHYDSLTKDIDRSIYADNCLSEKIIKNKVVDLSSLPTWVPENLKKIIKKATHNDPAKRFKSASAFHVQLNNVRSDTPDWSMLEGFPTLKAATSYRICIDSENDFVQKSKDGISWRKDNSIVVTSLGNAVVAINEKFK